MGDAGEVGDFVAGVGFPPALQGHGNGEIPFAKVSDVSRAAREFGGALSSANNWISRAEGAQLKARLIPAHSILFAKIGESIRSNMRAYSTRDLVIDNNTMAFVPFDALDPKLAFHRLKTIDFYELASATTVPSVRKSDLEAIRIAVPPLAEQRRIVAALDEALGRVRAARASLDEAPELLERARQAVLAAAFRGELTEPWRAEHPRWAGSCTADRNRLGVRSIRAEEAAASWVELVSLRACCSSRVGPRGPKVTARRRSHRSQSHRICDGTAAFDRHRSW